MGVIVMNSLGIVKDMIPVSVYSICCMDSVDASFEEVINVKNRFIQNMYNAWNFVLNSGISECDLTFIREINKLCGNGNIRDTMSCIDGISWSPAIPVIEDVVCSIKSIIGIEDYVERAIRMFCYITRSKLFLEGNKRTALLIANCILIQGNIGMLVIPDRYLSEFRMLLSAFYENGNESKLGKFLREYCILYFDDVNTKIREDFDCYARIYNLRGMYYPCKYARRVIKEEIDSGYRDGIIVEFDREYWVNSRDIIMC